MQLIQIFCSSFGCISIKNAICLEVKKKYKMPNMFFSSNKNHLNASYIIIVICNFPKRTSN